MLTAVHDVPLCCNIWFDVPVGKMFDALLLIWAMTAPIVGILLSSVPVVYVDALCIARGENVGAFVSDKDPV